MKTLAEIEAAAEALPVEQKQELLLFLAERLRDQGGQLPEVREFSPHEINRWIAEDVADLRQFGEWERSSNSLRK